MTRFSDGRKSENVAARKSMKRQIAGATSIGAAVRTAERGELMLELIRMDGGTQSRQSLDGETINDYAEAMAAGARFPAVTVFYDGAVYWLADGFHRVHAARQAKLISLPVELCQGTQRDAILFSVGANASHGKRRTNADKRQAVERLLRDDEWSQWADKQIAEQCAVSNRFVSNMRQEINLSLNGSKIAPRFVQRGGTTYAMNTGNIGKTPALQPIRTGTDSPPIIPALPKDIPVQLRDAVDSGAIGRTQAVRMNNVLARLPEDVRRVALAVAGDNLDKAEILKDLYRTRGNAGSNGTFDEIATTGGFHYGNELEHWCDFGTCGVLAIKTGLKSLSDRHKQMALDDKKQAQIEAADRIVPPDDNQAILTGDMALLFDALEDNSVDLFFTDPPYLENTLPEYTRLSELAACKLKPGGLLLTYSGQMFLPEVMTRLASNLTYWWTFVITHEVGLAIWNRNLQVKWKPVLVYAKTLPDGTLPLAPNMLTDRIEGGGRSKEYHAWGQDANEATYWIEKLCPAGGLVCDPYTGGGAIPLACHLTGRRWIATELDTQQAQIARMRLVEAANHDHAAQG